MSSLAVEGEDGLMLLLGMCELEFTGEKGRAEWELIDLFIERLDQ